MTKAEKTFIQMMNATMKLFEDYQTAYTKEGNPRYEMAPRFALMVQRCTNWAILASLIEKRSFDETKPVEVCKQYYKLVELYKKVI